MENNPINTTQKEKPISIVDKPTDMGTPAQHSPKFLSKGVAISILIIILVIFISGAIFAAYDLGGKNQARKQVSQSQTATPTPSPSPSTDPTANWQIFTGEDYTLKYPSNWKKIGNNIIAEKSFIPGEQVPGQNYNSVEIQKYANQIYKEYTNKEWFEKIQNLNQSDIIDDHGNSIERLGITGTTASGDRYVVVEITSPSSKSSLEDGIRQTKAYILKDQTIYQLTLDSSDNVGSEVFYKILPTFKITDSNSQSSDTSTWKTYTNSEYGISLKYPSSWYAQDVTKISNTSDQPAIIGFFANGTTLDIGAEGHQGNEIAYLNVLNNKDGDKIVSVTKAQFINFWQNIEKKKIIYISGLPVAVSNNSYEIWYNDKINISIFTMNNSSDGINNIEKIFSTLSIKQTQ